MKRKLSLIFACLAFLAQGIYAQDIIMKNTGGEISAKIVEVSSAQVKYKKFENPGGPDYSISSTEVFMIKYEDGSKTLFEKASSTGKIQLKYTAPPTLDPVNPDPKPPVNAAGAESPVQIKQANNGVFEMLGFDGKSVSFRAMVETPFSAVSLNSGERTFKASSISNTKGNIVFAGGATARQGSSLLLGNAAGMRLQKDTEARCDFENVPEGFVPKSIVFLTDEKSAPMNYDVASGIWIKPKQIGTPQPPSAEPYSAQSGEYDIVELIENNIVEAEISGGDITYVNLRIRRLVPYPVNVRVPVGSFFVSENPSAQNMVATGEKKLRLTTGNWQNIQMPAACANRPKDIPGSSDKFGVQRSPNQEELAQLMPVLNKSGAGTNVKQAAVWIITDNADYDDLGILVSSPGNTRAIGPETTARAMKICADAGIDITAKNIWRDRESIASKLPAGELKNWLKSFDAPKPAETSGSGTQTSAGTQTTVTASSKHAPSTKSSSKTTGKTFPVKVKYSDNDKIVPNTDIYFFYYDELKSALIETIANTGSGNIVEFRVPLNEDGSTYSFTVLLSKKEATEMKTEGNYRMFRIPPGEKCEYIQLGMNKGGSIRNDGCSIQITK
ncbi:MAG: hypothetical protein LBK58_03160 [Prevotellaceae bacterium]|jgi:hypothetical protein|nr:hypothetical protein [Prevotellaceae bacterium]